MKTIQLPSETSLILHTQDNTYGGVYVNGELVKEGHPNDFTPLVWLDIFRRYRVIRENLNHYVLTNKDQEQFNTDKHLPKSLYKTYGGKHLR